MEGTGRLSEDTSREYALQYDPTQSLSVDTIVRDRLDQNKHLHPQTGTYTDSFGVASSVLSIINIGLGLDLRTALKLQYSGF